MKSYFLVLEGPDGSGKTTVASSLEKFFKEQGIKCLLTREPGGTDIGEDIRSILLDKENIAMVPACEALLYAAARVQLVEEVIRPYLDQGYVVISDRFVHSSLAYQGYGRGLGIERVMDINTMALSTAYPHRIIFFDLDPAIGLKRNLAFQDRDRLEEEGLAFHRKVYNGFMEANSLYPKNLKVIDASLSVEEVYMEVKKIVMEDLDEINNSNNTR